MPLVLTAEHFCLRYQNTFSSQQGLPDLPKAPPSGELSAQQTERVSHIQHAALRGGTELESCCDEALEQGMRAVGAALELRVELGTQMEGAARQLHGLDQTAVGGIVPPPDCWF